LYYRGIVTRLPVGTIAKRYKFVRYLNSKSTENIGVEEREQAKKNTLIMEQRDYLIREIEKIGAIIRAIRQRLFGDKGNEAIHLEYRLEHAKGELLKETNFDLDEFLNPNTEYSNEYILSFAGFSPENIELLADFLSEIGLSDGSDHSKRYLEKALQLYNLCNLKSKVYSFDRERNMNTIRKMLQSKR